MSLDHLLPPDLDDAFGHWLAGFIDGRAPQAMWSVHRREDCLRLVAILDRFPLRAKKSRDFQVWRTAVVEWTRGDQSRMKGLKRALEQGREYREDSLVVALPEPVQPELGEAV